VGEGEGEVVEEGEGELGEGGLDEIEEEEGQPDGRDRLAPRIRPYLVDKRVPVV
jgi:hypothetical protein